MDCFFRSLGYVLNILANFRLKVPVKKVLITKKECTLLVLFSVALNH